MLSTFTKDPDERLDYDVDFSRWLPDGDVIAAATATTSGGSILLASVEPSSMAVRVWISGGVAGEMATVTVKATTAHGRIKEAAFRLRIRGTI